jgi:hypothetical protein
MKAILLLFVFNNFSESGLFNGYGRFKYKNRPFLNSLPGLCETLAPETCQSSGRAKREFLFTECILWISGFINRLLLPLEPRRCPPATSISHPAHPAKPIRISAQVEGSSAATAF